MATSAWSTEAWTDTQQAPSTGPGTYRTPHTPNSAFNRPIGDGATYTSADDPQTDDAGRLTLKIDTANGWSATCIEVDSSEELRTVTYPGGDRGWNLPYKMRIPPESEFPGVAETSDGQVLLYNTDTGLTHEMFKFRWINGQPAADIHFTDDPDPAASAGSIKTRTTPETSIITGLGHSPSVDGAVQGSRAIGSGQMAGIIREWEFSEAGAWPHHGHALECVWGQLANSQKVYPACAWDYSDQDLNTGTLRYGELIAIPPENKGGPDLDALGLSEAGMRFALSVRHYGIIVADRTSNPGFNADPWLPSATRDAIKADINDKLRQHFRVITNATESQSIAGGGVALPQP